jgi:hypothetical protein
MPRPARPPTQSVVPKQNEAGHLHRKVARAKRVGRPPGTLSMFTPPKMEIWGIRRVGIPAELNTKFLSLRIHFHCLAVYTNLIFSCTDRLQRSSSLERREMATPNEVEHFDVIICGCGPTGAVLSANLSRLGVKNLVIEREEAITTDPRGIALDEDGIRIVQGVGKYEELFTDVGKGISLFC